MWACLVAAFILLVAAFIAPDSVGTWLAVAAVGAVVIGLIIGGVLDRQRRRD
jgi:membrane protein implicated in regulation of membrane protease activity